MRFIKSAGVTIILKVFSLGFGVGISVLVGRILGPEGRGVYGLVMTILVLASSFGIFGFGTANMYFVAQEKSLSRLVGIQSLLVGFVGAVVSTLVILAIRWSAPTSLQGLESTTLLLTILLIPLFLWGNLVSRAFLGMGRVIAFNLFETVGRAIFFFAALVVLLWLHLDFDVYLMVVLLCLSVFLASYLIRYFRVSIRGTLALVSMITKSMAYGVRPYIAAVFTWITIRSGVFFVNYFESTAETGLFSVAQQISELMIIVPSIVGALLFPRVASGNSGDLTARVIRTMLVCFLPFCVLLALLAETIVVFLFGPEFAASADVLLIILPGAFLLGLEVIMAGDIAGRGYPWPIALVWIPICALNILGNLTLIPVLGIKGAALSSSISHAAAFVFMTVYLKRLSEFSCAEMFIPTRADLRTVLTMPRLLLDGLRKSPGPSEDSTDSAGQL